MYQSWDHWISSKFLCRFWDRLWIHPCMNCRHSKSIHRNHGVYRFHKLRDKCRHWQTFQLPLHVWDTPWTRLNICCHWSKYVLHIRQPYRFSTHQCKNPPLRLSIFQIHSLVHPPISLNKFNHFPIRIFRSHAVFLSDMRHHKGMNWRIFSNLCLICSYFSTDLNRFVH